MRTVRSAPNCRSALLKRSDVVGALYPLPQSALAPVERSFRPERSGRSRSGGPPLLILQYLLSLQPEGVSQENFMAELLRDMTSVFLKLAEKFRAVMVGQALEGK